MCEIIPSYLAKMDKSEIQALLDQENSYLNEPFESEDNIDDILCFPSDSQRAINQQSATGTTEPLHPPTRSSATSTAPRVCPVRQQNRRRPPGAPNRRNNKNSRKTQNRGPAGDSSAVGVEAWEANMCIIGQLRSENDQLVRQLRDTKLELRTVERQCKVQSARLTKAVGKEADVPAVIDRLNAEIQNLQAHLRRKTEKADASERRAVDMEQRLLPLVEKRRRSQQQQKTTSASSVPSRGKLQQREASGHSDESEHLIGSLKAALEKEQQGSIDLQKKLELIERTHRSEQSAAYEQIRKLRKCTSELESQLEALTRNLQEKTKLLELQNIYSQRLPKSVCALYPPPQDTGNSGDCSGGGAFSTSLEAIRERNRADSKLPLAQLSARATAEQHRLAGDNLDDKVDEALCRRYKDFVGTTPTPVPTESRRSRQHGGGTISSMVARVKGVTDYKKTKGAGSRLSSLFSRSSSHAPLKGDGRKTKVSASHGDVAEEEGKKGTAASGILGNALKRDVMVTKNAEIAASLGQPVPVPAARTPKKCPSNQLNNSLTEDVSQQDSDCGKLSDLQDSFTMNDSFGTHNKGKLLKVIQETLDEIQQDQSSRLPQLKSSSNTFSTTLTKMESKLEDLQTENGRHDTVVPGQLVPTKSSTSASPPPPDSSANVVGVTRSTLSYQTPRDTTPNSGTKLPNKTDSVKPDRFELCKEDRLWADLFGAQQAGELPDFLSSTSSCFPLQALGSSRTTSEDRKPGFGDSPADTPKASTPVKKTMMDILCGGSTLKNSPGLDTKSTAQQIANSMRRHATIRNPLEELDVEDMRL